MELDSQREGPEIKRAVFLGLSAPRTYRKYAPQDNATNNVFVPPKIHFDLLMPPDPIMINHAIRVYRWKKALVLLRLVIGRHLCPIDLNKGLKSRGCIVYQREPFIILK